MHLLLVSLTVVAGLWLVAIGVLVVIGRRTAARELITLLPNTVVLFRGLARDPRVPRRDKFLLVVAAIWVASPIDLIPEFIPVLGPLDDVVVVALVLRRLVRVAGHDVVAQHWRGDAATLERAFQILRVPVPSGV